MGDKKVINDQASSNFFRLFPQEIRDEGLRLDRLTVLGPRNPYSSFFMIEYLLTLSKGWKELNFINEGPKWHKQIFIKIEEDKEKRSIWQHWLNERDDATTMPLATMYQSGNTDTDLARLKPLTMPDEYYQQKCEDPNFPNPLYWLRQHGIHYYMDILVVAKRGNNVDYWRDLEYDDELKQLYKKESSRKQMTCKKHKFYTCGWTNGVGNIAKLEDNSRPARPEPHRRRRKHARRSSNRRTGRTTRRGNRNKAG
ncbi:hypothetical protein CHU98_g6803 [Xylaria longipes]|nr:hypothetical protein CHU98_g6803 [Xylaria longipes]